jgi:hypothetical protein
MIIVRNNTAGIYVPELLFFEMAPFDEVVREFALVEQELNAVPIAR